MFIKAWLEVYLILQKKRQDDHNKGIHSLSKREGVLCLTFYGKKTFECSLNEKKQGKG